MGIAALYDIHGNLPALEAVLAELGETPVDELVVGGDVFPGPQSGEALDRLLALQMPVRFLHGNGDRAVLSLARGEVPESIPEAHRASIGWVAKRLEPRLGREVATWPATLRLSIDGLGEVLFCHATPRNDTEIFTRRTPAGRLGAIFEATGAAVVVCGHTHMQFDRRIGGVRVVNAGSVGMPCGEPGAHWLLLGPEVELRRTPYDLAAAAERIRATDYPDADGFAARCVLSPPSEERVLELFRGVELGQPGE